MADLPELNDDEFTEVQRRTLKRLRERRIGGRDEPSQGEIAGRAGYSGRHYGDIERGRAELSREHMRGLMRAYGVPASYIYERLRDAAREVEAESAQKKASAAEVAPPDDEMGEVKPRYETGQQPLVESFDVRVWLQDNENGMLVLTWLPGARRR